MDGRPSSHCFFIVKNVDNPKTAKTLTSTHVPLGNPPVSYYKYLFNELQNVENLKEQVLSTKKKIKKILVLL